MELRETPVIKPSTQPPLNAKDMGLKLDEKPKPANREQLATNILQTSSALTELTNVIRYYPDAPKAQLLDYFERTAKNTLTPEQRELLGIGLDIYHRRHEAIKKVRQQHPNDQELFSYLFGKPPKGKVEVIQGPITIYFRCHNLTDYALIYNGVFEKSSHKRIDEKEAKKTSGIALSDYPIPGLENGIIAEKTLGNPFDEHAKKTLVHEEQHQIMALFQEAYKNYYLTHHLQDQSSLSTIKRVAKEGLSPNFHPDNIPALAQRFHQEPDIIKKGRLVANFLRQRRQTDEAHAKDEILAFFQEGDSISHIRTLLTQSTQTGGSYDFSDKKGRAIFTEDLVKHLGKQHASSIHQLVEGVLVNEYQTSLHQAFDALSTLSITGLSREQVVNLLMNIPLSKWKPAAKILKQNQDKKVQPLPEFEKAA